MDGVSAAASLTALVGFALQSSSFIYQIVNTILDGPNQIKSLASRVNGLHTALIQIAELLHSQPPLGQDQNHPLFKRLRSALQACAEDLQKLQLKLQKLNRSHEKGLRRAWYIVKSVLGAKEFEDADTIIKEHVQNLGLHLEIIGSTLSLNNGEAIRDIKGIAEGTFDNTSIALSRLKAQSHTLEGLREKLADVPNHIRGLQELQLKANHSVHFVSEQLNTKFETMSSKSSVAHAEIVEMLRDIRLQVQPYVVDNAIPSYASSSSGSIANAGKSITSGCSPIRLSPVNHPGLTPGGKQTSCDEGSYNADSISSQELADRIDRLCSLASKKPGSVTSQEAESVIDDLDYFLDVIGRQDRSSMRFRGTKRKTRDSSHDPRVLPNMTDVAVKRIRRVLAPSQTFNIGKSVARRRTGLAGGMRTQHVASRVYEVQAATIVISHSTKRPQLTAGSAGGQRKAKLDPDGETLSEMFEGTITLQFPKKPHRKKLNVSFHQRVTSWGTSIITPAISFHSMRPMGSEVFNIAAYGDVQELIELLQGADASLSDCDPEGRSLLHYALFDMNIKMCKFLIEHHADVDSMERDKLGFPNSFIEPPLNQVWLLDCEQQPEELACSIECKKLLLEAGADPTLSSIEIGGEEQTSAFQCALRTGTADSLCLFLQRASHYLDIEARNHNESTAFMAAIQPLNADQWQFSREKARLLLNHGAKIDTQNKQSTGCFHGLFKAIEDHWLIWVRDKDLCLNPESVGRTEVYRFLTLLLDRGGEPLMANSSQYWHRFSGCSVTERAFSIGLGKVWLATLKNCSHPYDISEFLAEDHARICNIMSTRCHRKSTPQQDYQNRSGTESTFAKAMLDDLVIDFATPILKFPACSQQDCDWVLWEYLDGLNLQPDPKEGPGLVTEWALSDRTPDLFLKHNLPDIMYEEQRLISRRKAGKASGGEDFSESETKESDEEIVEGDDGSDLYESEVEELDEEADEKSEGNASNRVQVFSEQGAVLGGGAIHSNSNPTSGHENYLPLGNHSAACATAANQPEQHQPAFDAVGTQHSIPGPTDGHSGSGLSNIDVSEDETSVGRALGVMSQSFELYEDPSLCFNPWG